MSNATQITVTREAYDVLVLMQAGLGSNRIAKALGVNHSAVLSRQNTLETKGVISGGTMDGQRRQVLLTPDQYRVEPEHRATVAARAKADRDAATARDEAALLAEAKLEARKAARAARKAAKVAPVLEEIAA